jgi:beta-galactosidase
LTRPSINGEKQKNSDDYHRFFDAYSGRDVQIMVKRDRNHPSIMFWSIGNEIQERADASGVAIAKELRRNILVYDSTRLITAAVNDFWDNGNYSWDKDSYRAFQYLDVGGYNYMYGKYVSDHAAYPQRVMMGTESYPKLASQNWDLVEAKSYVIGDFVWTAMDYLGEAGIGHVSVLGAGESNPFFMGWPWYNGWCGDIDIIGQKKPQSYYRDVVWRNSPITMAVEAPVAAGKHTAISGWGWQDEYQSWTFPEASEGTNLAVNVYSRSSKVRLYLNGVLLGEKAPSSTYWAGFSVPYKKGTLKAVQYDGKTEGASFELKTTGTPVGIRLVTDSTELSANGTDLAYVTAELIDEEGNVVRNDSIHVAFSCSGEGALIASGNGAPNDMESFRSTNPRLFHGRAMAILRTTNVAGDVTLKAEATGFESQTIRIKTTKQKDNATSVRSGKLSADDIKIYAHDHHIYVIGAAHYSVFNTMGVAVDSKGALASGVYVVKANNQAKKVALIF